MFLPNEGMKVHRKIIHITAEDSPNVRLALAEIAAGKQPSHRILVPGVLSYREYQRRRRLWDPVRQRIGLDAKFDDSGVTLMFPPDWLDESSTVGNQLGVTRKAQGRVTLGVDSAQGGDNTAWCIGDDLGVLRLLSRKTPDTSVIVPQTIELIEEFRINDEDVCFDHGGGGKEHADLLRRKGFKGVRIINFGSAPTDPNFYRRQRSIEERKEERETKYRYKNRRAEIYGLCRNILNPMLNEQVYGIPTVILERPREDGNVGLRGQLAPIPLLYDGESRMYLSPKNPPSDPQKRKAPNREKSLTELIGCSPDEADAFGLMVYAREVKSTRFIVGRSGMK